MYDMTKELVGMEYLRSEEKLEWEAEMMQGLQPLASRALAMTVLTTYNSFGYTPFDQPRYGQGWDLRQTPKVQTQSSHNVPHGQEDQDSKHPVLNLIRKMSFDELRQALRISTDPKVQGEYTLIGFRPQMPEKVAKQLIQARNEAYTDLASRWLSAFKEVPTGLYDITSLLDNIYTPGSKDYDMAAMKSQIFYHENASLTLDKQIFYGTIIGGILRLKSSGLVSIMDPKEVFGREIPTEIEGLLAVVERIENAVKQRKL